MSNKDDVRGSLLTIAELLKQLTEEVESLASCFYDEDEDEDEDGGITWRDYRLMFTPLRQERIVLRMTVTVVNVLP